MYCYVHVYIHMCIYVHVHYIDLCVLYHSSSGALVVEADIEPRTSTPIMSELGIINYSYALLYMYQ